MRMIARALPAVLALLFFAPMAAAQEVGESRERTQLVDRLALNSAATLRAFQSRAAEDQRRLYVQLSERDLRVAAALTNVRLERRERRRLEDEMVTLTLERSRLADQLAQRDLEFSAERAALIEQFTGIVAAASPEKEAALRRFADGDRLGAFEVIAEITYAENAARERAVAAASRAATEASVRNLNELLGLAGDMLWRGEKTVEDMLLIEQQRLALDPSTLQHHIAVIDRLTAMTRNEEAIAVGERAVQEAASPWDVLIVEGALVAPRMRIQPFLTAYAALEAAERGLLAGGSPSAFSPEDQVRYCSAMSPVLESPYVLGWAQQPMQDAAAGCAGVLLRGGRTGLALSIIHGLAVANAEGRQIERAQSWLAVHREIVSQFDAEALPVLVAEMRLQQRQVEATLAVSTGRRRDAIHAFEELRAYVQQRVATTTDLASLRNINNAALAMQAFASAQAGDTVSAHALLRDALGEPVPFSPEDLSRQPDFWDQRVALLLQYAVFALDVGDVEGARAALAQSGPVIAAGVVVFPAPAATLKVNATALLCNYLAQNGLQARLSEVTGDLAEAERLATFPGLELGGGIPLLNRCYDQFRIGAHIMLGGVAAQRGDIALARTRLQAAVQYAGELRQREPEYFTAIEQSLEARLRLAQLDAQPLALEALRAEAAAVQTDGREILPSVWSRELASWQPGQPITWFVPPSAAGPQ